MAKTRKGHRLPKGAKLTDTDFRPQFLTEEEAKAFMRERRLYNRRVQARIRKMRGLIPEGAEITDLEIRQTGMTGIKWHGGLQDLKNRREYEEGMRLFEADKEPPRPRKKTKGKGKGKGTGKGRSGGEKVSLKEKRENNLRETTFDVICEGFDLNPDEETALRDMLDAMSIDDIIRWRFANPDVVRDYFERYKIFKETGEVDPTDRQEALDRLFKSLKEGEPVEEPKPKEMSFEEIIEQLRRLTEKGGQAGEEAASISKQLEELKRKAQRLVGILR